MGQVACFLRASLCLNEAQLLDRLFHRKARHAGELNLLHQRKSGKLKVSIQLLHWFRPFYQWSRAHAHRFRRFVSAGLLSEKDKRVSVRVIVFLASRKEICTSRGVYSDGQCKKFLFQYSIAIGWGSIFLRTMSFLNSTQARLFRQAVRRKRLSHKRQTVRGC